MNRIVQRTDYLPTGAIPRLPAEDAQTDTRFRTLLGETAWAKLPAAVRRRFSKRLSGGASLTYQGVVTTMRISVAGRLLAQLARAVGAPLPFDISCVSRPAVVVVTEDPVTGGQFWIRQYGRASGFPQTVHSSKRFSGPTGLEEYVGYGFGMTLTLEATPRALYFLSDRYFFEIAALRVWIPRWLCPGRLAVGHRELGGGRFVFSLDLKHPLFGALISQEAVFRDGEIIDGGPHATDCQKPTRPLS